MSSPTVWSRRIADELWSGVVTPLTYSLLSQPMSDCMVHRRLARAGLDDLVGEPVFQLVRGHVYVNASLVARVMAHLPAIFISEGLLDVLPEDVRDSVRSSQRTLIGPGTLGIVLHLLRRESRWMPWTRAEAFRREAAGVARDLTDYDLADSASAAAIAASMDRVEERLSGYLEVVSWGMIYAYVFFHLTAKLVASWSSEEAASAAELTAGLLGIRTFEIHDELVRCAARVRHDDGLRRLVVEQEPAVVAERALRGELGDFGRELVRVLDRHGHRFTARDLSQPTWREQPAVVVDMLRKLVCAPRVATLEERRARREQLVERTLDEVSRGATGPVRRLIFLRALGWCQEYYAVRENMRYHADIFLAALRALALRAGRLLTAAGRIEAVEDVFYLTRDELRGALQDLERGTSAPAELSNSVRLRRLHYEEYRVSPPPEVLQGTEVGDLEAAAARGAHEVDRSDPPRTASLHGLPASPGRAEGAARIVRTVDELTHLCPGEVIVAPATDPAWTSMLALGCGLVLEVGGLLSHGAIVARELGIPAVVDVRGVTRLVATGDQLTVDGGTGIVGVQERSRSAGPRR